MLKIFLFLILYLGLVAPQSFGNEYVLHVDASAHQKFGLYYPITYKFAVPAAATGLIAQYRYSPQGSWNSLAEKTSSDTFNGIDAVRFDHAGGWAYVSIGFSPSSDDIYLRMVDGAGQPVDITFASIPTYYDGRKAAVTVTLDDWTTFTDAKFRAASDFLAADELFFTVGVITGSADWNSVQQKINQHGRYLEVASHSKTHVCKAADYVSAGYEAEIIGSRDSIRNNLTYWGHPYVPVFLEPCGYTDATLASTVSAGDYLLARRASDYFPSGSTFIAWDSVQSRYGRSALVFDDSSTTWGTDLVTKGNSLFDQAVSNGGIYHLLDHPRAGYWYAGSYLLQHLDYIKGRTDIWYASLGQLYLYHFLQEMRGSLSLQPVATPPQASFTASPVAGTAPLAVTFTDTSTGAITDRLWDFGDSTSSTEQNPMHVYGSAGSYSVRLTATGPGGSHEKVEPGYVVVVNEASPVAGFSAAPRVGTAPFTASFTDTSTGSVSSRLWDFGDSTTSTEQNPVHVYGSAGSYAVKLTVTGPGGSNEKVEPGYVVVNEAAPVASFSATPLSGTAPLTVSFADTSTGPITAWLWDFGDSNTSTDKTPVHVYNSAGTYSVKLAATGPGGSSEKVEPAYVVVSDAAPVPAFSATPRSGPVPLTAGFTDTSTGAIAGRLWDFGDSTTSTDQNPVHVYNSPGTYSVKLTVTGPGGSSEKVESAYVVVSDSAPIAAFSATPLSGPVPLTVSFSDTSTGAIAGWLWDFGDSTTSTERMPVHVYTRPGSYTVRLTATGSGGSNERVEAGYVVVNEAAPIAGFTATPRSGPTPLSVSFTDNSTGPSTSRLWDFGDSTTSTEQNPIHVYNSAGSYTVKLTVTGPGGSNDLTESSYILVNEPLVASFSATLQTKTIPNTVSFTDTSSGPLTSRLWDFGDSSTSTEQNPEHVYDRGGSYAVTLTITGPGEGEKAVDSTVLLVCFPDGGSAQSVKAEQSYGGN